MSPERGWKMRVEDILACIEKIDTYTAGITFEQFKADDKTVDAVIRNFEIIGEAAGQVSASTAIRPACACSPMGFPCSTNCCKASPLQMKATWEPSNVSNPPVT